MSECQETPQEARERLARWLGYDPMEAGWRAARMAFSGQRVA